VYFVVDDERLNKAAYTELNGHIEVWKGFYNIYIIKEHENRPGESQKEVKKIFGLRSWLAQIGWDTYAC
jgi:hypothetical protein